MKRFRVVAILAILMLNVVFLATGQANKAQATQWEYGMLRMDQLNGSAWSSGTTTVEAENIVALYKTLTGQEMLSRKAGATFVNGGRVETLNFLGSAGWEVVWVIGDDTTNQYLLKRKK